VPECGCAPCALLRDTGYELGGRIFCVFTSSLVLFLKNDFSKANANKKEAAQ